MRGTQAAMLVASVATVAGLLSGYFGVLPNNWVPRDLAGGIPTRYSAGMTLPWEPGDQIVFVFFGSPNCAWCTDERVPGLVSEAQAGIQEYSEVNGLSPVFVGVALSTSVDRGLDYLKKFQPFDQVSVGASMANEVALGLPASGLPRIADVPQVVVYRRHLDFLQTPDSGDRLVSEHKLLARKIGLWQIMAWVRNGTPLPVQDSRQQPEH